MMSVCLSLCLFVTVTMVHDCDGACLLAVVRRVRRGRSAVGEDFEVEFDHVYSVEIGT